MVILLGIAMLLVDFILMTSMQRAYQDSIHKKGRIVLSTMKSVLAGPPVSPSATEIEHLNSLKGFPEIQCLLVLNEKGLPMGGKSGGCPAETDLKTTVDEAVKNGDLQVRYIGGMWSVLGKQPRSVIMAVPVYKNRELIAGAGVVLSLEWIYRQMGQSQKMIVVYIVINIVILSMLGVFGLSQVTVKPLKKLVKRADEYRPMNDVPFYSDPETSEFNRLSRSLNRMFNRIAEDKIRLESTVSSLELANHELKRVQEEMIRAEKFATVGKLASGIAHEIGNPLGIVIGYLELLRQNDLQPEEGRDYLKRADEEIQRINVIIRQLLQFSRSEPTQLVPVSVGELLEDIVQMLKVQPMTSILEFQVSRNVDEDMVIADPEQLRQVFVNVILNAAEAMASDDTGSKGLMKINIDRIPVVSDAHFSGEEQVCIRFEDNGPGIPEKHMDKIFDPFFTTKDPGKGTGLGLSVSYRIIEGFGGVMEAVQNDEDRVGIGAVISVRLPITNNSRLEPTGRHSEKG